MPWDRRASGERLRRSRRCSAHGTRLRDAAGETRALRICHTRRASRKRSTGNAPPRAGNVIIASPWRTKPHFSSTRREAGLTTRAEAVSLVFRRHRRRSVDQRPRGLGGVAVTPVRRAEPEAEMRLARHPRARGRPDPDHADAAWLALRRDRQLQARAPPRWISGAPRNEASASRIVRMGNPRRHLRDGFLTGETDDGCRVGLAGPAQPERGGSPGGKHRHG